MFHGSSLSSIFSTSPSPTRRRLADGDELFLGDSPTEGVAAESSDGFAKGGRHPPRPNRGTNTPGRTARRARACAALASRRLDLRLGPASGPGALSSGATTAARPTPIHPVATNRRRQGCSSGAYMNRTMSSHSSSNRSPSIFSPCLCASCWSLRWGLDARYAPACPHGGGDCLTPPGGISSTRLRNARPNAATSQSSSWNLSVAAMIESAQSLMTDLTPNLWLR